MQRRRFATMELQQVNVIGAQAFEASREAELNEFGRPVLDRQSRSVTAFRKYS
jgi:hypothetical protein